MADRKQDEKEEKKSSYDEITNLLQYPTRKTPAPSSVPQPINKALPVIATPNEALLPFDDSDYAMFLSIHNKYGKRLQCLYPDDTTRFVQGYSHEKERHIETYKRIDELLKRGFTFEQNPNEYNFHTILDTAMAGNDESESLKAWPVFMYGYDNEGHPVMYDEIGCSNPDDLDSCFDGKMRKLKTFRFRILRRLHNTKRMQNLRYSYDGSVNDKGGMNGVTKHIIVMDIQNFYAKSLTAKYRNLIKDIIGDESNLWPNTLEKMYIINAPWPFRFAWKIISNFIHPITVKKIAILGSDYITEMTKKISIDQIPKSYGGKGEWPIKYGYTADIENDVIDGDYCQSGDPIDLESVSCIKNNHKKVKVKVENVKSDDAKEKELVSDERSEENGNGNGNGGSTSFSDDSYVKVKKGNAKEETANKPMQVKNENAQAGV